MNGLINFYDCHRLAWSLLIVMSLSGLATTAALAEPELTEPQSREMIAPDGPVSEALRSAEESLGVDRSTASDRLVNTLGVQEDSTSFFSISIPEPATAGLIGLAAVILLRYRSRNRA